MIGRRLLNVGDIFLYIIFLIVLQGISSPPTFIPGELELKVDKLEYNAGDNITVTYYLENKIPVPAPDIRIVLQLTKTDNVFPVYPPHIIENENTIAEYLIDNIHLKGRGNIISKIDIQIPENAPPGTYRLDGYALSMRSPMTGIPFIYYGGITASVLCSNCPVTTLFKINNDKYDDLMIFRPWLLVSGIPGQVGRHEFEIKKTDTSAEVLKAHGLNPSVFATRFVLPQFSSTGYSAEENETIIEQDYILHAAPKPETPQEFLIPLLNNGADAENVSLLFEIYYWDDTEPASGINYLQYQKPVYSKQVYVGKMRAGELKNITGTYICPLKPTAYSVKITVYNDNRITSIFRSRIDVYGMSSRIAALMVNKHKFKKNEEVRIKVVLLGSADGISHPKNIDLSVSVINNKTGEIIYTNHTRISEITIYQGIWIGYFMFNSPTLLTNFTVHAELKLNGKLFDVMDLHIDKDKFPTKIKYVFVETLDTITDIPKSVFYSDEKVRLNVKVLDEDMEPKESKINVIYAVDKKEDFYAYRENIDGIWTRTIMLTDRFIDKDIQILVKELTTGKTNKTTIRVIKRVEENLAGSGRHTPPQEGSEKDVVEENLAEPRSHTKSPSELEKSAASSSAVIYDIDKDGIPDSEDPDIDGDGILNSVDSDIDGDGIKNEDDPTPFGESQGKDRMMKGKLMRNLQKAGAVAVVSLFILGFIVIAIILIYRSKRERRITAYYNK